MLCPQCKSIFSIHFQETDKGTERHCLYLSGDGSSACRFCALLYERLRISGDDQGRSQSGVNHASSLFKVRFWLSWHPGWIDGTCYLQFEALDDLGPPTRKFAVLLLALESEHYSDLDLVPPPRALTDSTSSSRSLRHADKWLKNCRNNHSTCRLNNAEANQLPSRLLRIEYVGGKPCLGYSVPHLRLVETSQLQSTVQYMTLSHCWGSRMVAKLLKYNYSAFLESIPYDDLPQVFKDAAYIAARAGINYLWIDGLCIIQDSKEDWATESVAMGSVYRNGVCNIAGTGFLDGTNGLFVRRNPSLLEPIEFDLQNGIKLGYSTLYQPGKHLLLDFDLWNQSIDNAPLNRRGWVIQERWLSVRTLHFGSDQLFWECAQQRACELFPTSIPRRIQQRECKSLLWRKIHDLPDETSLEKNYADDEILTYDLENQLMKEASSTSTWGMPSGLHRWRAIVQQYSTCSLTFSTDRLMAVAGLAKDIDDSIESQYLAGLWRDDLEQQLAWNVLDPKPRPTMENSELRGPSWSWASVDGKIAMPYWDANLAIGATTILAHVIDAEVIPMTGDEFGLIRGGKIRILSSLGVIRLPITDDGSAMSGLDDPDKRLQDQEVKIAISWDTLEMASLLDPHRQNLFEELNRKENLMEIWTYFPVRKYDAYNILPSLPPPSLQKTSLSTPAEVIRDVFYLPLHIIDEDSELHSHRTLKGLLLMPTRKEKGEFRRVGQFEVLYDEVYNKTSTEAMKRSTATLDPEYYESADGQSQYIMTII